MVGLPPCTATSRPAASASTTTRRGSATSRRRRRSRESRVRVDMFPYDGNGSRLPANDPLTHPTANTYDALNRLLTVTQGSFLLRVGVRLRLMENAFASDDRSSWRRWCSGGGDAWRRGARSDTRGRHDFHSVPSSFDAPTIGIGPGRRSPESSMAPVSFQTLLTRQAGFASGRRISRSSTGRFRSPATTPRAMDIHQTTS